MWICNPSCLVMFISYFDTTNNRLNSNSFWLVTTCLIQPTKRSLIGLWQRGKPIQACLYGMNIRKLTGESIIWYQLHYIYIKSPKETPFGSICWAPKAKIPLLDGKKNLWKGDTIIHVVPKSMRLYVFWSHLTLHCSHSMSVHIFNIKPVKPIVFIENNLVYQTTKM